MQKPENREYQLNWARNNRDKARKYSREWHREHPEWSKEWDANNPEKRKEINKKHEQKPERKAYKRMKDMEYYHKNPEKYLARMEKYRKENPRSGAGLPYEEVESMMETRIRFKNTCKWYACGLTSKETSIHVHHIFPKEEYPELACISKYQITYCKKHHAEFHRARGDKYWKWILGRKY